MCKCRKETESSTLIVVSDGFFTRSLEPSRAWDHSPNKIELRPRDLRFLLRSMPFSTDRAEQASPTLGHSLETPAFLIFALICILNPSASIHDEPQGFLSRGRFPKVQSRRPEKDLHVLHQPDLPKIAFPNIAQASRRCPLYTA